MTPWSDEERDEWEADLKSHQRLKLIAKGVGGQLIISPIWYSDSKRYPCLAVGTFEACQAARRLLEMPCTE